MPGEIFYVCASCADSNPEGCCRPRDDLREMPGGRWVCFECYDCQPSDFVPSNKDEDAEFIYPLLQDMPRVPKYVPKGD